MWDKEPLQTVRQAPRLFGWGISIILAASFAVAYGFRTVNLRYAVVGALCLCGIGIAALYGMAQRQQTDPLKDHLPGSNHRVM